MTEHPKPAPPGGRGIAGLLRSPAGLAICIVLAGAGLALAFEHRWLQPMDGPDRAANTRAAVAYCLAHPRWRLSVQTHKMIGIP